MNTEPTLRPSLSVYTHPPRDDTRRYYLMALAEREAAWRDRVSVIAGRVLLISTIVLGFLL
jgi:hypothetical protein